MGDFEEFESGQKISEADMRKLKNLPAEKTEYEKRKGKVVEKVKTFIGIRKPEDAVPDIPEEFDEFDDEFDEDIEEKKKRQLSLGDMQGAEEEVRQRQMLEWREKTDPAPENPFEMDNKLLEISATMSKKSLSLYS